MELSIRNDETPLQHHKRLVYGKLVDKTLADVDYSELAEAVYGQSYASDVARRMMYGSRRTLELLDGENITSADSQLVAELDAKLIELRKERQRLSDQRRELNKTISKSGRAENLYEYIARTAQYIAENEDIACRSIGSSEYDCSNTPQNEAVLVFSDWHYGMVTDNIYNKFDTNICIERINTIVKKAVDRIVSNNCSKVHIIVLGDLFHGAIHTSARVASEELVCEQMMHISEVLAQSIIFISGFVNDVEVHMTYGNHARTIQNKNDSIHSDNMERIVRWWLEQRCSGYDSIKICEESKNEFIFVDVMGHTICATHGDIDSVKGSAKTIHTLMSKTYGIDVEYFIMGDKHHYERFDEFGITSIICGSLCGTDDYANDKRLYTEPSQLLLIVNEREGIDAEYKLKCK